MTNALKHFPALCTVDGRGARKIHLGDDDFGLDGFGDSQSAVDDGDVALVIEELDISKLKETTYQESPYCYRVLVRGRVGWLWGEELRLIEQQND